MYKVGIIGPEASGKSTLARYLARRYKGVLVPEYGREYVEKKKPTPAPSLKGGESFKPVELSYDEVCEIAKHQIEEIRANGRTDEGTNVVFYDTELIVTKVWFEYAFGRVPEWLEEALRTYKMDVYLLCKPDIAWVQDGARFNGSDEIRQELFERYEREIEELGVPYYIIEHE